MAFVPFAALIFLTWGEIFTLFPSTCTDTFGPKFATVNLSLLYTAKGTSAFVRYCFEDPLDAEIFRARFEPKAERFKLAG